MGGRVDLTSRNVLYYSLSRFSINLSLLPLSHLVSVSAGVTLESHSSAPSLLFPPHYSLFFYICISLPSPYFNVFLIFFFCSVSILSLLWSLCEICAWTSQPVTLLLWPWRHCRVEMTPELPGSDLFLSFFSQLQPYLSTQPHFFSSLNISPSRGQAQGGNRWAGVN